MLMKYYNYRLLMLLWVITMFSNVVHAQNAHKWVDENGVTHFSSQPPAASSASVETYELQRHTNVVAADSENSFVSLARLSAPGFCYQQLAGQAQASCVAEQIAAAREIGQLADQTTDPKNRFAIQICQQRHLFDRHRPADFVSMRECIGQQ